MTGELIRVVVLASVILMTLLVIGKLAYDVVREWEATRVAKELARDAAKKRHPAYRFSRILNDDEDAA